MTRFPHLLQPLHVRGRTLSNRMVMGAMHTRLETLDQPHQRLAAFYAARAHGEVGLILTGGHAPVPEGVMDAESPVLSQAAQVAGHRVITDAVHAAGGRIVLQILHAGRYARVPECVAPSAGRARINTYTARALSTDEVWATIEAFAHTAALAEQAGYDGVEVMGSEGYLLNEFTSAITNLREDAFGGDFERRLRMPLEVVRAIRARVSDAFWLVYRISAIDLMDGGMTAPEVASLAQQVQAAGADILNTGIGWHESAVPTIAAAVPRAAWVQAVRNIKQAVQIPVMASNRINTPEVAEAILAAGDADLISMARPLLADPDFARKVRADQPQAINTCIACNQACLDAIFTERSATCLVNPRAGREIDFVAPPPARAKRIAVVGGGPAGMSCAIEAARRRGHRVTLWEASEHLGGQLRLARQVPGKREFDDMLRYFRHALADAGVTVQLGQAAQASALAAGGYDEVVVATGVRPRVPDWAQTPHPKVLRYDDVLQGRVVPGQRVAVLGAGGIGFDVAAFLLESPEESTQVDTFMQAWGVDLTMRAPGGLTRAEPHAPRREVVMFQRKPESMGKRLGKTTGWVHKAKLKRANVQQVTGVTYLGVDDAGLHYAHDGQTHVRAVDHVVLCVGQEPCRDLVQELQALGIRAHCIGGAHEAGELDAQRAIDQATRLALTL